MKSKIKNKIIATLLLLIIFISNVVDIFPLIQSLAVNNNSIGNIKNITSIGTVEYHLKSHDTSQGSYVITHLAGYYDDKFYPAYCMQRDRDGAGKDGLPSYDVEITNILQNDNTYNKIWRVVTNGYPYKDLGMDWTYAYQATKMAVYCVTGQARVDEFYADDDIGQAIISKIRDLAYIGEHGTETYKTPLSDINEQGDVTLNGDYYVKNYNLTSNLELSGYTIDITNFPSGTYVADSNGNAKSSFNVGESFQIKMPKAEFEKQDVNGKIRAKIQTKDNAVFYGYSYDASKQDYVLAGDPISLTSSSTTLHIKNNNSIIKIYKVNEDGKAPISGVTFELLTEDGRILQTSVTDQNGIATFNGLYAGTYYAREKDTVEGYLLNDGKTEITVPYNSTSEKTLNNYEPTGKITILKRDSKTGATPQGDATLENAVYKVYANEDIYNVAKTKKYYSKGDLVATRNTDKNGVCSDVTDLPLGEYLIKEETPPEGYLIDKNEYIVNLTYKDQYTEIITGDANSQDKVKEMKVHIFKSGIKENSGETPGLAGAEFTIKLNSDVQRAYEKGYTYEEVWGGIDEFGNEVAVDNKRVQEAQVIAPTYSAITTDENGDAYTEKVLPYGKYIVKETKTPKDYESAEDFTFSIKDDESEIVDVAKKVKNIVVNNEQLESYIKLVKKDLKTGKTVTLNNATFQIKATKDIYDRATGKILYKKGEVVTQKIGSTTYNSFTTNAENIVVPDSNSYNNNNDPMGSVVTPLQLEVGSYEVTEVKIPEGFLQLEEPVKFKVEGIRDYDKDKDGDFIVEVVIKNEQPVGTIILDKSVVLRDNVDTSLVDISDLSGIQFKLTAKENIIDMADGNVIYKGGQEVGTYNISKAGDLKIENLPMGIYELQEVKTLDGLVLNDTVYEIKFTKKDDTTKVYTETRNIENETTIIEFSKTDITGESELEGAKLSVLDKDGNIIDSWTSSKETHKIEGLKVNTTYVLREEIAPDNFVKATDVEFIVDNTGEIQKVQMIDKVVEMTKEDIAGEELEGAKIQVLDKENKIVDEWTSSKEAHKINNLEEGKTYTLHEEVAIEDYVKATDIEFTVTYDKTTQHIRMIDKILEVKKTDFVTGDEVEGAELKVVDEDGNVVDEWISTKESHKVKGLEENKTYKLIETTAPYGYEITEEIEFKVSEDKKTQLVEMKDMPILKDVKVIKKDSNTKEIIKKKFVFGLYTDSECTKLLQQMESNKEEGTVTFEDLRYGTYYIKEIQAPKGYQLSNKVVEIKINDEGVYADNQLLNSEDEVYSFSYYDDMIPKVNTGIILNNAILIGIAVISLLGIATGIILMKRKNK